MANGCAASPGARGNRPTIRRGPQTIPRLRPSPGFGRRDGSSGGCCTHCRARYAFTFAPEFRGQMRIARARDSNTSPPVSNENTAPDSPGSVSRGAESAQTTSEAALSRPRQLLPAPHPPGPARRVRGQQDRLPRPDVPFSRRSVAATGGASVAGCRRTNRPGRRTPPPRLWPGRSTRSSPRAGFGIPPTSRARRVRGTVAAFSGQAAQGALVYDQQQVACQIQVLRLVGGAPERVPRRLVPSRWRQRRDSAGPQVQLAQADQRRNALVPVGIGGAVRGE